MKLVGLFDKATLATVVNVEGSLPPTLTRNGCWIWTGNKNMYGYGRFKLNKKDVYTHRYSYEIFRGKIPKGLELDHLCKNRDCLNPDHLEAVTHKENILRGKWGENSRKTHCPQDHEYTDYKNNRNQRVCKICLFNKRKDNLE
jgi:hypothetical protein